MQIDQVMCPDIALMNRIIQRGDFLKLLAVMRQQRIIDTQHPFAFQLRSRYTGQQRQPGLMKLFYGKRTLG